VSTVLELGDAEVHVWHAATDAFADPVLLQGYSALLSAEERARQERFVFERDRHQFLVAHGVLRTLLSRYATITPSQWRFTANRYGRPAIAGPPAAQELQFSLSHTTGLVAIALARDAEVGVDAEDLERRAVDPGVARSYFSPEEVAELESVPPPLRARRFLEYWTLKEAYVKARGLGLSLPLDEFSILLPKEGPPALRLARSSDDDASSWQLAQLAPSPRHLVAVAVRTRGRDVALRVRPFVPE
jgi:4'-phosphopantetheinyl transferase